jgi:hypothetical protein
MNKLTLMMMESVLEREKRKRQQQTTWPTCS